MLTEYTTLKFADVKPADAEGDEACTMTLPSKSVLSLAHQTTHGLRSLASSEDVQAVSSLARESLLTLANSRSQSKSDLIWNVEDGKVREQASAFALTLFFL